MSDHLLHWLAALHFDGIGAARLRNGLTKFETVKNFFDASPADLQLAGLSPQQIDQVKNPNWTQAEKDLNWCEKSSCHIIFDNDENYPRLLRELPDAPVLLFVQ